MTNLREVLRARYGQMGLDRTMHAGSCMSGSAWGDDNQGETCEKQP